MHLITYSYFWQEIGSDKINLKIVTDTLEGHELFVSAIKDKYVLNRFGREYVHEFDVTLLSKFDNLLEV